MNLHNRITLAYYRLFYFFLRIETKSQIGNNELNKSSAIMAILPLTLIGYIDMMALEYLFSRFIYNLNISQYPIYAVSLGLVSLVFNGMLFLRNKKYYEINEMFSNEEYDTRFKRSFGCIVYSLATMFGYIFLIAIFGYPK